MVSGTFSTDLHWTEHYNTIIAKAYQTLGLYSCHTFNVSSIAAKKATIHLTCKTDHNCSTAQNYVGPNY